MKRSFRVATVFTGAAALAGGFGPTALAATALQPNITNQICGANDKGVSKWLHLFYPNDDHPAECFHETGLAPAKGTIHSFCPGSTSGWISGTLTTTGDALVLVFGPTNTRFAISSIVGSLTNFNLRKVNIDAMTGEDYKCLA